VDHVARDASPAFWFPTGRFHTGIRAASAHDRIPDSGGSTRNRRQKIRKTRRTSASPRDNASNDSRCYARGERAGAGAAAKLGTVWTSATCGGWRRAGLSPHARPGCWKSGGQSTQKAASSLPRPSRGPAQSTWGRKSCSATVNFLTFITHSITPSINSYFPPASTRPLYLPPTEHP